LDSSLLINLAALAFSLLAIIISSVIALHQARYMKHANLLPVLIEMLKSSEPLPLKSI